ncbi:MAG: ferrous iron transport protein B, partial [Thermoproteota archaeon]
MVKRIRVALAGNANVGKSVLFNELTGLHQHIGNWPGKTVERAEGTLHYRGYEIDVIDLPGIYSLSTFSIEELISREYIALERPDVVVNVVDASNLERNLVFTVQLLELEAPMVLALNQMDMAKKMGVEIDVKRLSERLGVPVVPMVAVKGLGIKELLDSIVDVYEGRVRLKPLKVRYGREVEKYVEKLRGMVEGLGLPYPARWVAVKLLEEDEEIVRLVASRDRSIVEYASRCGREIEGIHGEPCPLVISFERCNLAGLIAREVQT